MQRDSAGAAPGRTQLSGLRHLQWRLLLGGGGLISVLVLLTVLASAGADIAAFHAAQRQHFLEAQSAVDDFLLQRDRAFATSINANDVLWKDQQPALVAAGTTLATELRAEGGALVVRSSGVSAVPWLVLTRELETFGANQLEAYLGLMLQFSMYTVSTAAPLQTSARMLVFAHDPQGRMIAVAGFTTEAQLRAALHVESRQAVFEHLLAAGSQARREPVKAGPVRVATASGRLWTGFAANPLNGDPSMVGELTLADGTTPYLRRVQFESMDEIRSRLDASVAGAYLLVDPKRDVVLTRSGASSLQLVPGELQAASAERVYRDGQFIIAGPVRGVDWYLVHPYNWRDLWEAIGVALLLKVLAAMVIIVAVWVVLLRLQRRVVTPAMADASRVYESEALSRVIIDTSPVGLALLDPTDGHVLLENDVARAISGVHGGQDDAALYPQLVMQASSHVGEGRHEFQWGNDGEAGPPARLQVSMSLAKWRDSAVWVCALRDVTVQAELEDTLRAARRDAERARAAAELASRAKSGFVATMSHEIRTPLNGVLGHLELLGRSPLQPDQAERLQRIRLSADSLMAIISDVLDFSKIEAGQLDIDPTEFALRPLIEQAALLYAPDAQRRGVKVYYAIDPGLPGRCRADVHRIRQILNNLLGNAVKFTESGRIVVRASRVDAPPGAPLELRLQVVDSGIGLSAEQLGQLFQPFQQADASISRRYGGSGLGLALCQQLAHLLGGSIRADSTLGVGSVFTLEVPLEALPEEVPAVRPLQDIHVTLLSAAAEWRLEIGHLLQAWGAQVQVIDSPLASYVPNAEATLLVAGERRAWAESDEMQLLEAHARVVRAYPTAPLSPQERADGTHVSVFASDALLKAVQGSGLPADVEHLQPPMAVLAAGNGRRVLLAEDNPVNRELIQQQLDALGYAVDVAENGREALAVWQPGRHLAVLTDISMPVMNGYELARALRAQGVEIPILAITATALASEREHCRQAGITDLLLKPLDLNRLASALQRYLGNGPEAVAAPVVEKSTMAVPATPLETVGAHLPEKVRRAFVDTASDDLALLRQAALAQDRQVLLDRVHAFKGVLMMIGERTLGGRCSALELQLRDAQLPPPEATINQLVDDLALRVAEYASALEAEDAAKPSGRTV